MKSDEKQQRILCLDDEAAPLAVYKHILEPRGYEVLTSLSSTEALAIMSKGSVDLLIQDIARPGINGIELYRIMKSDERLLRIPVVICSGAEENRRRFLDQYPEIATVFEKPFEVEHLLAVVQRALLAAANERTEF